MRRPFAAAEENPAIEGCTCPDSQLARMCNRSTYERSTFMVASRSGSVRSRRSRDRSSWCNNSRWAASRQPPARLAAPRPLERCAQVAYIEACSYRPTAQAPPCRRIDRVSRRRGPATGRRDRQSRPLVSARLRGCKLQQRARGSKMPDDGRPDVPEAGRVPGRH